MNEIRPKEKMKEPFVLHFDNEFNLWISEHGGSGIIKFDPILNRFQKISILENNALPAGLIHDNYGNIWFAQHTADRLGIYDPHHDNLINIDIPTSNSFTQFVTLDNKNKIWFVEQRTNKLGVVNIIEIIDRDGVNNVNYPQYFEIVAPIIGIIVITLSLFIFAILLI